MDFEAQGRDRIFAICHAHLKKAISIAKLQKVGFLCKGLYDSNFRVILEFESNGFDIISMPWSSFFHKC